MILFPAIDLKDGQCVRLKLGDMNEATVFNDDPAAQAKSFEDQGFEYLHVVDLNGAFAGESVNGAAVEAILAAVNFPVQLGGGIRTIAHDRGLARPRPRRVILGTVAVRDPALVREAASAFPGRSRSASTHAAARLRSKAGPRRRSSTPIELGQALRRRGRRGDHLHRHRSRRRAHGHQLGSTLELARAITIPVIASGGLASMDDIRSARAARERRSSKAPSPAARFTMAASTRGRRWRC